MACCRAQLQGAAQLVGLQGCFGKADEAHGQLYYSATITNAFKTRIRKRGSTLSDFDLTTLLLKRDPTRKFSTEYTLMKQLGSGAFGSVYKAQSVITQDEVAVKVIAKSDVKEDIEGVVTELEALTQLSHPNIASFYEYFEAKKCICLVMELIEGGDFHSLFKSKTPQLEVQFLFRDVLMGIAYCHDIGICHRDLKLENCLICQGPNRKIGKVIDFGLAAIRKDAGSLQWLEEALGTKYFVAPEVIDAKQRYGMKCDVWSVGVMLFIVLTNQHPFAAEASKLPNKKLFHAIQKAPIRLEPLQQYNVNKAGRDLVFKLLSRNVEQRPGAEEALNHEWLRPKASRELSLGAAWGKSQTNEMIARIGAYGKASDFEKVVRMLVAHRAKVSDMEQMRRAFVALDSQSDGSLTQAELRKGIKSCGVKLSEEAIQDLFDSLDANHSRKIDYYEWLSATMDTKLLEVEGAMKDLFHYLDTDGSGSIDLAELRKIVSDGEAGAVIKRADSSHDGLLQWDEFQVLMHEIATAKGV